jgi:hypothetical protein
MFVVLVINRLNVCTKVLLTLPRDPIEAVLGGQSQEADLPHRLRVAPFCTLLDRNKGDPSNLS